MTSAAASVNDPEWMDQPLAYVIVHQSVRDALTEISHNLGISSDIATNVKGDIDGKIDAPTTRAYLDAISRSSGLSWFYADQELHVANQQDSRSRRIRLGSSAQAQRLYQRLSATPGHGQQLTVDQGDVVATGSPAWLDHVASRATPAERSTATSPSLSIFRGSVSGSSEH
ncbi:hypothetical protein [Carnimonas bestiolae]|uniref:hypothetical protein n=1 Tax=Carnimonas bestiolae TaxID=3402172 RepID=UPI003F4AD5CE